MGIDLNTSKTSHDSLISMAVKVKTYNSCYKIIRERVSHVIAISHASMSANHSRGRLHTIDTPLQTERSKQRLKAGWGKSLLFLNYDYF